MSYQFGRCGFFGKTASWRFEGLLELAGWKKTSDSLFYFRERQNSLRCSYWFERNDLPEIVTTKLWRAETTREKSGKRQKRNAPRSSLSCFCAERKDTGVNCWLSSVHVFAVLRCTPSIGLPQASNGLLKSSFIASFLVYLA